MTEQPYQPEAVAAAGKLSGSLDTMSRELRRLSEYGRNSRHMILALGVSLVLDLALTVIVAIFAVQAHDASDAATTATSTARHAYASNKALCVASNTSRRQTIQVWVHLLDEAGPPKTAASRRFEDSFIAYLNKTYAPRNCSTLGAKQ